MKATWKLTSIYSGQPFRIPVEVLGTVRGGYKVRVLQDTDITTLSGAGTFIRGVPGRRERVIAGEIYDAPAAQIEAAQGKNADGEDGEA